MTDIQHLELEIKKLKKKLHDLEFNGTGKICPVCETERMINLPTIDSGIRQCGCGHKESNKLKPNQKSVLVNGLIGE